TTGSPSELPSSTPTRTPASPSPDISPSPSVWVVPSTSAPVPDPRSVPVRSLLRPGTKPVRVVYGDLDGDGVEDIAVSSAATHGKTVIPQSYLDVFLFDGNGGWTRSWEATGPAPPGVVGSPATVLLPPGSSGTSQQVDALGLVDTAGDGSPELAVGGLNIGAGPGALDVWGVSVQPGRAPTQGWA